MHPQHQSVGFLTIATALATLFVVPVASIVNITIHAVYIAPSVFPVAIANVMTDITLMFGSLEIGMGILAIASSDVVRSVRIVLAARIVIMIANVVRVHMVAATPLIHLAVLTVWHRMILFRVFFRFYVFLIHRIFCHHQKITQTACQFCL